METIQKSQNPVQLHSAPDRHVFNSSTFVGYLMPYTLFLNRAVGGERICSFNDNGALLELHYRNKLGTNSFIGFHKDPVVVETLNKEWGAKVPWATFKATDLSTGGDDVSVFTSTEADKVISLTLPEGISRTHFYYYLQNFYLSGNPNATYFIQLPKATDLISEKDIKLFVSTYFNVVKRFGVAGTIGDFKPLMNDTQVKLYNGLLHYYSEEFITGFLAPFFPDQCQQCMWILKRKS